MTNCRAVILSFLSSCVLFAFTPAHADIGGIGSPVVPSNQPRKEKGAPSNSPAPIQAINSQERTPILIIRFNQQHVNFDRALRQVVEVTHKAKPGAVYDVVSNVPTGGTLEQSQRIGENATTNLNSVVDTLESFGVPAAQIRAVSEPSPTMTVQEIDIFID